MFYKLQLFVKVSKNNHKYLQVQKPTRTEKEVKKEWGSETKTQELTKPAQSTEQEDNTNEKSESKNHSSWRCLNKSIESEKEMEFAVIEKGKVLHNNY